MNDGNGNQGDATDLKVSTKVEAPDGRSNSLGLKVLGGEPGAGDHERDMLAVSVPSFEGPLDLLLHLVREHRLDIFDIPIAFITKKYVEMLEHMRVLNLDVAGEFLVMAATLAHIKSRMLLPKPEPEEGMEDGGAEIDPREELVRRLLTYQKYREAAAALGSNDILGRDVFTRRITKNTRDADGDVSLQPVGSFRLIEALDRVLERAKVQVNHEVIRERLSLAERLTEVVRLLGERGRMTFREMFGRTKEKEIIVLSFLALLEMSRLGLARIAQEEPGGDIMLVATDQTAKTNADGVRDDFQ